MKSSVHEPGIGWRVQAHMRRRRRTNPFMRTFPASPIPC